MCALPIVSTGRPAQEETLPLFQRELRERLSPTALELLLTRAEVLVEGGNATGASAAGAFFGSAMMTIDLAACKDRLRPPHDAGMAERLKAAILEDAAACRAIQQRALLVARARLSAPEALRAGEPSLRVDGARLLVDLELESRGDSR